MEASTILCQHKTQLLKDFIQSTFKVLNIREKMVNLDFTNTSNFWSSKCIIRKMK